MPDWSTHKQGVNLVLGNKKKPNKILEYALNELKKDPKNKVHVKLYEQLLKLQDKPKVDVNNLMDWPYKILGPKHRVLFHDPLTVLLISAIYGERAGMESLIHLGMDYLFSSLSKEQQVLLKAFMNVMCGMK